MEKQLQKAVNFFKGEKAYDKLFKHFRKKYESLGRIGGTVSVSQFTDDELGEIAGFFGVSADRLRSKSSISIVAFGEQLAETRFADLGLKAVLDAYFGEEIISKKQKRRQQEEQLRSVLNELKGRYPRVTFWLDYLLEGSGERRWILQLAEEEPAYFERLVSTLAGAFDMLPEAPERLPLFSQRVTGDPHAFDLHTDLGRLLLHLLALKSWRQAGVTEQIDQGHDESPFSVPVSTEAINGLLQEHGIYRDDLLNYVTCSGFFAETEDGSHPVWEAAVTQQTVQIIPIRELVGLSRIYPAHGNDVWIVENSGVCATLLDHAPDSPIVCTNGQFTLAVFMLLDRLAEEGCILHYAGDLDPEGLGMAERLLDRYPEGTIQLWHMDTTAYRKSSPVKALSSERLEKLSGIMHTQLLDVAGEMRQIEKAGYQEALMEQMVADVQTSVR